MAEVPAAEDDADAGADGDAAGEDAAGAAAAGAADDPAADDAGAALAPLPSAWIAFCCASSVVLAAGHPFPGPFRFCSVSSEAWMRASCDSVESSSGKVTATEGLLTAFPAATLALRDWGWGWVSGCSRGGMEARGKVERSG